MFTFIPPYPFDSLVLPLIVNYFKKCFCSEFFLPTGINLNMASFSLLSTQPNGNWNIPHWCVLRLQLSTFEDIIQGWKTPCLVAQMIICLSPTCVYSIHFHINYICKLKVKTCSSFICTKGKEISALYHMSPSNSTAIL